MHSNLTPCGRHKFLARVLGAALFMAAVATVPAQDTNLSGYQGPGILSRGVGDLGSRSGAQLDLRFYAGVSGVMDTNIQPFVLDARGNLLRIHNLYGIELSAGAYGVHTWNHSQLGVDYRGSYRRYLNQDIYRGSDQSMTLGYTLEASRRWTFDLRESLGTLTLANSQVIQAASSEPNSALTPTTLLFDARTDFLQSTAFATYRQSARMSYSFGGTAFLQDRKSQGLSNSWGYDFTGTATRRLSKKSSLGVTFVHSHYEFPAFLSQSDSNAFHGQYTTTLGRFWTFSLEAGATVSEVESLVTLALNPTLAALFGQPAITGTTYLRTIYPSGSVKLKRQFRRATVGFNYFRGLNSGNGAYNTARLDSATVSIGYTAARKLNLGVDGGYYSVSAIGQNLEKFSQYSAAAGFTYGLGHAMHLFARYDLRDQQIDGVDYRRTSSRASLGLLFSPGTLPLALW